ncbi:hypothetical protein EJB05_44030, partial [Eragrostis curvula]
MAIPPFPAAVPDISQVVDEGGTEIEEVSALAVSCTKYRGEERPSMRQVEMALEATKEHDMDNIKCGPLQQLTSRLIKLFGKAAV